MTQNNAHQLQRAAQMAKLTQTGRDTPMGKLLRQFWHPVALSKSVEPGKAREIRALGEDLVLYRGASGNPYLLVNRCAHRLTKLHTGWVEGEQIRCMYHGWKYDGTGQCVERPAERPGSEKSIRITGYPVHEYLGLVFTYMGDEAPPPFDLPRKLKFEADDVVVHQRKEIWPCNWFQCVENSLDSVHVSFTHQMGKVGAFGEAITAAIPELDYVETDAGMRQTAIREVDGKPTYRISDWTFPHTNHVKLPNTESGEPWIESVNFMVPIDDTHTLRVALRAAQKTTPEADAKILAYLDSCDDWDASEHHDELFAGVYPDDPLVRLTTAQDYVTIVGQGTVADRANECLGASDRGLALLRRIFFREMDLIESGAPTKVWRRNADNV